MTYRYGLVIPQTQMARLEHRRGCHTDAPEMYINHWHARIRWSRFALMWSGLAAQMVVEALP